MRCGAGVSMWRNAAGKLINAGKRTGCEQMSPALRLWKEETEARLNGPIVEVRVGPGATYPALLVQLLQDASLPDLLARAHALSLQYRGPEGNVHYILLNTAFESEWGPHAEALLAHEIGHA